MPDTSANKPRFTTITLATPIVRGETSIETIDLRKPQAGELRGLTMQEIIGLEVSAILKLVPRISSPALIADEVERLEPEDLTEIAGAIRGFFMTKAERAVLEAVIAEHRPKS